MEKTKELSLITPYNLFCLCHIAQIYNLDFKRGGDNVPNRVKIIRDFDNLLNDKYIDYNVNNEHLNNITLSNNTLFSKLQKIIFKKINNYSNLDELRSNLLKDMNYPEIYDNEYIYEIANTWCKYQYGLI
jgi:hypothetical protein